MNSMGLSCLFFSHILPLATTEMLLVETYNDTMHDVAPKTNPNEPDQKSVGSNKEVGHLKGRLEVGQDYRGNYCVKCEWQRRSPYCRWVVMLPKLQLSRVGSWVILYQFWRWCFILVLMLILTYCDAGNCRKCRQCAKKEGWCKICRSRCKRCRPCFHTQGGPTIAEAV